jgi:hypothetical protein
VIGIDGRRLEKGFLMKKCALVISFCLVCSPSFAASDGGSLLNNCKEAVRFADNQQAQVDYLKMGLCLGMVNGVKVTMQMYQQLVPDQYRACIPQGVNNGQMARIAVKLLEENPQRLHENDVALVVDILRSTYPCQ